MTNYSVGIVASLFSKFTLLGIGFMQGASMQILWIRLGCTLDEIQGKSCKESIERATKKICFTYWFNLVITIICTGCAVYLTTWLILLFTHHREKDQITMKWLIVDGYIYFAVSVLLVVYLLFAYIGLRMKLHEIFGKQLSQEFKMLECNFTVMVVTYVLLALYSAGYGYYDKLICKTYIRWILDAILCVIFESSIIISILNLHHQCAKVPAQKPQESLVESSVNLAEVEDIEFEAEMLDNF